MLTTKSDPRVRARTVRLAARRKHDQPTIHDWLDGRDSVRRENALNLALIQRGGQP